MEVGYAGDLRTMTMPRIVSHATALPSHRCDQSDTREAMAQVCRGDRSMERLLPLFDRTGVETRYFVRPLEWLAEGHTFETRNRVYAEEGLKLVAEAARSCLDGGRVRPEDVDHVYVVTTTGLTTPSLDARLVRALGLRPDVRRVPLFGLGCAGGAGGLIRAADAVTAFPSQRALVISLELCSLVFSPTARSATDLVGTALFGDGAAAVLVAGDEASGAGPAIGARRTHLFQDQPDLMGWDFTDDGMRLVLSRDVPEFVATGVTSVLGRFLGDHDLTLSNVTHFLLHPGGAKVMATYRTALGLDGEDLIHAREAMRRYGNQSSASVLFMLDGLLSSGRPRGGDTGLMLALGPGFAAEMLVLRW